MALVPFIIASLIGRGARFFLVAGLMRWGGARMETAIRVNVERLGWLTIVATALMYVMVKA
jgi:hypothetical protein